jgi:hypothetical protein
VFEWVEKCVRVGRRVGRIEHSSGQESAFEWAGECL